MLQFKSSNTRFFFSVDDGPVDRRGAAILWQQREMNVDAAALRRRQKLSRQNLSVGDDYRRVGFNRLAALRLAWLVVKATA